MSIDAAPVTTSSLPPPDVSDEEQVAAYIRAKVHIPTLPVTMGIDFVDVTPLMLDPEAFQVAVEALAHRYRAMGVTHVVGCEARGFIFGAPVAIALKAAFVPVYQARKVPRNAVGVDYAMGFYSGRLGMQSDAIPAGGRVVVIYDFVATVRCLYAHGVAYVQDAVTRIGMQ